LRHPDRTDQIINEVWHKEKGILLKGRDGGENDIETPIAPMGSDKDEKDLVRIVSSILGNRDTNVRPDIVIDDRDLKEFPSFYHMCTDPKGFALIPFARQLMMAIHLLGEFCYFCSDKRYIDKEDILKIPIDLPPLDLAEHVQFLEYGRCPNCQRTKLDLLRAGRLFFYQEFDICAGMRSGKSTLSATIAAYLVHRLLKLQNPAQAYNLAETTTLTGTFVAQTFDNAVGLIWTPFQDTLNTSPFFKEYFRLLDYYVEKYDDDTIYRNMGTFLHFRHRHLLFYPAGPNKRTLRGRTRSFSVIDEIGWMDSEAAKIRSAEEVYTALDRSLLTVRVAARKAVRQGYFNVPNAYALNISSPSDYYDMIMTLVRQGQGVARKRICSYHLATWEVNPNITRGDLETEFLKDPVTAARDYGAAPPLAEGSFIGNEDLVWKCATGTNLVSYHYIQNKRRANRTHITNPQRAAVIDSVTNPGSMLHSFMALDAGYTNNSFAIVIGTLRPLKPVTGAMSLSQELAQSDEPLSYHIDITGLVEVAPEPGLPLNFGVLAERTIYPLIEKMNVKLVVADRWNSIKLLNDIESKFGITVEQYSLRYLDCILVRSYIEGASITFPKVEMSSKKEALEEIDVDRYPHGFMYKPASHLFFQLCTVVDTGKTIEKAHRFTDDLVRATFLCCAYLLDTDYHELLDYAPIRRSIGGIGTGFGLSGGYTGQSLGGTVLPAPAPSGSLAASKEGAFGVGRSLGKHK